MKYNTRFNPTACGDLHMGHLYMALVNATEAHRTGGRFSVRVDDTQPYWVHNLGKKLIDQYASEYHEQLSRFMVIDDWLRQSTLPSMHEIVGETYVLGRLPRKRWINDKIVEITSDPTMAVYPYDYYLTVEKVIWDFYAGVNYLIRGEDMLTESSLYAYFDDMLGIPIIKQVYLPRLRANDRDEIGTDDIELARTLSKTFRTYRLGTQIDRLGIQGAVSYTHLTLPTTPYV